jgi:DNA-binding MarR family transcriptional regulator
VPLGADHDTIGADDALPGVPQSGPLVLFTHLARTTLFLEALQDECLRPFGLSFVDYSVLRVLRNVGPPHRLSPSRLADVVLVTTGGMTKIVDRLERAGLVTRTPAPADRRGVLVALTRRGVALSERASAAYQAGRERIIGRLADDEVEAIDVGLRRLLAVFEDDRKGAP